jgi:hypothetical protein
MDDLNYHGFDDAYPPPRYHAGYDYEAGYIDAIEDCQLRNDNLVIISMLLVFMIASVMLLILQPCIRRPLLCRRF